MIYECIFFILIKVKITTSYYNNRKICTFVILNIHILEKSITIAIITNATWNIYNFRLNILHILTKSQYRVMVIAPEDEYKVYQQKFPMVKHIPLKQLSRKGMNPFQEVLLCHELFQILKREKPDLVINYTIKPNIYGGIVASLLKIKYLCVVTGLGYTFLHNGLVYSTSKVLYRMAFKKAESVIFENVDDKNLFNALNLVEAQKSFSVKGCGVDTLYFQPMPKTEYHDGFIFCFIGRFLWDKGIGEFVEAAKIVRQKSPSALFWLVGERDENNPSCVSEKQIKIWEQEQIIVNQGFAIDVRPFIRNADSIVLPSYREGMPTVLAEAAAMSKPIITTDVAGCREMVDMDKNGYIVSAKSAEFLAAAMLKMLELPTAQLAKMGAYGRRKVEREFDNRLIADFFLKMVEKSIGKNVYHKNPNVLIPHFLKAKVAT
jgi:glycosyltransferase involved in cell wall biosynthesis